MEALRSELTQAENEIRCNQAWSVNFDVLTYRVLSLLAGSDPDPSVQRISDNGALCGDRAQSGQSATCARGVKPIPSA